MFQDTRKEMQAHFVDFISSISGIIATDAHGREMNVEEGIERTVQRVAKLAHDASSLIFIGNGGSAAIASHQSTDFLKTCKIRAFAPLDHSLITCMGNDCGFENVFAEPLRVIAQKGDLLIAISSSGRSQNILNAVAVCKENGCDVVTLSGFDEKNALRALGWINFYVPSSSYRIVESAHLFICNWLLEFTIRSLSTEYTEP